MINMKSLKVFLLSLCILFAGNVFGQAGGTLTIKDANGNTDFTVAPGEEFDMQFWVSTEYDGFSKGALTAKMYMPEGIEIVGASDKSATPVLVGKFSGASTNLYYNDFGSYVTVGASPGSLAAFGDLMEPGEGYILSVKCKVTSATVSDEPYIVEVKEPALYDNEDEDDDYYFPDFTVKIYVKEAAAETETVTLTKEYNTYVPTKALDFSGVEGIKAYYVTAVTATEATLTETTTVAAGEGIIISGTPDTYEVPVATTEVAKSTTNKLATGTVSEGDYILYDGQFVLCTGGTLPDGKAYLPKSAISTSSAKALILGFGDATGINEAKDAKADGAIYSISGVRVAQPQKGVYIMNGRKVIVK